MDKFEYKVRADEIKTLIAEGDYTEAAAIADSIDWRRVKSVMMLCTVSDVYKINRRYEESKEILLLAYERHPGGRLIVYSLCELCLKLGEFVQAIEYYKEFVQVAPKDNGRYILQYKIYEAQDVSLEERIAVLEELKRRDYREKWAYELAYLYHRVGLATKCVEECDEIFAWFGEGRYVLKALELKQLHVPITEEQTFKLEKAKQSISYNELDNSQEEFVNSADGEEASEMNSDDYYGETMEADGETDAEILPESEMYMTGEMSQGYEMSMGDEMSQDYERSREYQKSQDYEMSQGYEMAMAEGSSMEEAERYPHESTREYPAVENYQAPQDTQDMDIRIKPVDVSQYNTINLQQELAESMKEILFDTPDSAPRILPEQNRTDEIRLLNETEVYFGDTAEMEGIETQELEQKSEEKIIKAVKTEKAIPRKEPAGTYAGNYESYMESSKSSLSNTGIIKTFIKPSGYDEILTQEYDGQISLVMPEEEAVEKQITGQLKIDDILAEWEKQKKEIEHKRMEEVRRRVQKQTDTLFADFDEATKSGLLEKLEKAMLAAVIKEEEARKAGPNVIKVADIGMESEADKKPKAGLPETEAEDEEVQRILAMTDEAPEEELPEEEMTEEEPEEGVPAEEKPVGEESKGNLSHGNISQGSSSLEISSIGVTAPGVAAMGASAPGVTNSKTFAGEGHVSEENTMKEQPGGEHTLREKPAEEILTESETSAQESAKASQESEKASQETQKAPETQKALEAETSAEETSNSAGRELSDSEKETFGRFVHHKKTKRQLIDVIDNISMAAYTGNVIITGEEGTGGIQVAKGLIKEVQQSDSNFSGKVAKVSGDTLNKKDVAATFSKLENGAIIIEKAARMKTDTVKKLMKVLEQENTGYIVILEDSKPSMNQFVEKNADLNQAFNLRIDLEALDDQSLVAFARKYAEELEYAIDDLGVLALHTRIADMQTSDHEVTVAEVQEMVEEAIYYADKINPKHFFDILVGKRYDEEDMIVLRERDFMHY